MELLCVRTAHFTAIETCSHWSALRTMIAKESEKIQHTTRLSQEECSSRRVLVRLICCSSCCFNFSSDWIQLITLWLFLGLSSTNSIKHAFQWTIRTVNSEPSWHRTENSQPVPVWNCAFFFHNDSAEQIKFRVKQFSRFNPDLIQGITENCQSDSPVSELHTCSPPPSQIRTIGLSCSELESSKTSIVEMPPSSCLLQKESSAKLKRVQRCRKIYL